MNTEIMILILTILQNGIGNIIDEYDEFTEEEIKERLNHLWTICNHNVGKLESA